MSHRSVHTDINSIFLFRKKCLHVTQKNDYPITVLRGHSVCEVVLDRKPVGYIGISKPEVII